MVWCGVGWGGVGCVGATVMMGVGWGGVIHPIG